MKSLTNHILESRRTTRPRLGAADKKYNSEYLDFFDFTDNYRKPINISLAVEDWGDNVPKKQPKGSVVIGTGKLKDKAIITNDGEDNIYDEIVKLAKDNGDLDLYVQVKYHGDDSWVYPVCKVSDEGDYTIMVSVAPNARLENED